VRMTMLRDALTVVILFLSGFALATLIVPGAGAPLTLPPEFEDEIAIVLYTSTHCAASRHEGLPAAWKRLVSEVREALPPSVGLRTVGVNIAGHSQDDREFLEPFGPFDEVALGSGVRGISALRYVLDTHPGPAATPQIIVLRRSFAPRLVGDATSLEEEELVTRLRGSDGILLERSLAVASVRSLFRLSAEDAER